MQRQNRGIALTDYAKKYKGSILWQTVGISAPVGGLQCRAAR